jgi:hypothetical protein
MTAWKRVSAFHPNLEQLEVRTLLSIFAAARMPGRVEVFNATGGAKLTDFRAYSDYFGRLNLAVGDFNRDGVKDLATAPAVGNPHVKIFDGQDFLNGTFDDTAPDNSLLASGFVYGVNFNVGATLAAADVDNDGFNELITGATEGNPHIKVFDGEAVANGTFSNNPDLVMLASFFAYGLQFNIGAYVAGGDINNDGFADVITGAIAGNPHVKAYNGSAIAATVFNDPEAHTIVSFFPYALQFNVGAAVAVGDTNGDTFEDLITGASTGNPDVRTYDGQVIAQGGFNNDTPSASQLTQFFAYPLNEGKGARVAALDFDGNGSAEIITGNTNGNGLLRLFAGDATGDNPNPILEKTFDDDLFPTGIAVA